MTASRSSARWHALAGATVVALSVLAGCSSVGGADRSAAPTSSFPSLSSSSSSTSSSSTSSSSTSTSTAVPPTTAVPIPSAPEVQPPSVRDRLAVLVVDDRPSPSGSYRREDWPHWSDTDGNGCDARQDALVLWSTVTATVNRSSGCKVVAGSWRSPYDGKVSNNPSDFDIDHLVPLEDAFISGGWKWTAGQRRAFANDQRELVAASASSNRSKGSKSPDEWRPSDRSSWCAYADGWVSVKQTWSLTVTTSERDALGQMLDTCDVGSQVWPGRG